MKLNKFSGRLFLTIAVSSTFCIGSLGILLGDSAIEIKMAIFTALSAITSSISKDYFTRSDRKETE